MVLSEGSKLLVDDISGTMGDVNQGSTLEGGMMAVDDTDTILETKASDDVVVEKVEEIPKDATVESNTGPIEMVSVVENIDSSLLWLPRLHRCLPVMRFISIFLSREQVVVC